VVEWGLHTRWLEHAAMLPRRPRAKSRTKALKDEFARVLRKLLEDLRGLDVHDLFQRPAVQDIDSDLGKLKYLHQVDKPMDFSVVATKLVSNEYVSYYLMNC